MKSGEGLGSRDMAALVPQPGGGSDGGKKCFSTSAVHGEQTGNVCL